MSTLAGTESRFQAHVLAGDPTIAGEIVGDDSFRQTRLGIYRDAYRLRLAEVLGTDFEVLKLYVGDEIFEAIARDYIDANPSDFRNVRWFGGRFAEFLRGDQRYSGQPALADLARFEWTLGLAFDAADATPTRFEDLAAIAPEAWTGLRLLAHPALQVVELETNAVAIWRQVKHSGAGIPPESLAEPQRWAIWRKDESPHFRSLEADEAWALEAMRTQAAFPEICAGLCRWSTEDDAAQRAATLLRGWVDEGWIAGLETAR